MSHVQSFRSFAVIAKFAATILRFAEAHSDELRQAVHNAALMRCAGLG